MSLQKKVNINKCTRKELTALRGVGSTLANRIITFREKNGPYYGPEDLAKVEGISLKLATGLAPKIDWTIDSEAFTHIDSEAFTHQDITRIYTKLQENLKQRDKKFFPQSKFRRSILYTFSLLLFFLGISFLYLTFNGKGFVDALGIDRMLLIIRGYTFSIICLMFSRLSYLKSRNLPKEQELKNLKLWSLGVEQAIYRLLYIPAVAVFTATFIRVSAAEFYPFFLLILTYCVFYMVYAATIAVILIQPKLFLSSALGGIGSGCRAIAAGCLWGGGLASLIAASSSMHPSTIFIFLVPTLIVATLTIVINFSIITKLNWVQLEVMSTIYPDRLWNALCQVEKGFRNLTEAIQAKVRFDSKLTPEVKVELIKLYAAEKKSRLEKYWWIGPIITFVLFAVGAIGEGFIQDLIYEPFKPVLCGLGIPICN